MLVKLYMLWLLVMLCDLSIWRKNYKEKRIFHNKRKEKSVLAILLWNGILSKRWAASVRDYFVYCFFFYEILLNFFSFSSSKYHQKESSREVKLWSELNKIYWGCSLWWKTKVQTKDLLMSKASTKFNDYADSQRPHTSSATKMSPGWRKVVGSNPDLIQSVFNFYLQPKFLRDKMKRISVFSIGYSYELHHLLRISYP